MPRRLVLLLVACAGACAAPELPRPALTDAPTHERYTAALSEFGLDKTALGQDWLRAAGAALANPVPVTLPFREAGYLAPNEPGALAYQFELQRGRRFEIDVTLEAAGPTRLFIDLFEMIDGREPELVASVAPEDRQLEYEARRNGRHVLRVQPELLRGGRFTITQRSFASLGFPIDGLSTRDIQSVFGDPRDAGRRNHHGVDIFAPRGTPVRAVIDGRVRTDTGNRGGKVIWLSPLDGRRRRLYYAHLDDWAVASGAVVRAGEIIGYVGNTGNARTTLPHLHFGVYDRGPVDPYAYLSPDDPEPAAIAGDTDVVLDWLRVVERDAPLRASASSRAEVLRRLAEGEVVRVRAASGGFYRVELPDGGAGFVSVGQVTRAVTPLRSTSFTAAADLRDGPHARAVRVETLRPDTGVDVLGRFGDFQLVRLADSRTGWVQVGADAQ